MLKSVICTMPVIEIMESNYDAVTNGRKGSRCSFACVCSLGCLLCLIGFIFVGVLIAHFNMDRKLQIHKVELKNLETTVEDFWRVFLQNSIRIVDNETDTVDIVVLHRKKNDTGPENIEQMLLRQYSGKYIDQLHLVAWIFFCR